MAGGKKSQLEQLLADLAGWIGVDLLAPDANGVRALRFDDRHVVGMRQGDNADELWLFCDLGAVQPAGAPLQRLMQANLFWRESLGATFSLTQDEPPHVVMAVAIHWRDETTGTLAGRLATFVAAIDSGLSMLAASSSSQEAIPLPSGMPNWLDRA